MRVLACKAQRETQRCILKPSELLSNTALKDITGVRSCSAQMCCLGRQLTGV